jgi:serine protease inhibitor
MMSEKLVDTINMFGFQLHSHIIELDKPSGLCAMNIYQCLAMVATGCAGDVLTIFEQCLGSERTDLHVWSRNTINLDSYCQTSQTVELNSASSVWPQKDFLINQK